MFSICLPELVASEFRAEADRENWCEWKWLSFLLEMSFHDPWVVEKVGDCPHPWPVNVEVRLEHETLRRLRYVSKIAEISPAAYVQRLLYHVYVTREIIHSNQKKVDSICLAEYRKVSPVKA